MSFKAPFGASLLPVAALAGLLLAVGLGSTAHAQSTHSISGSAGQFYIGNGLPIPIRGGNTPVFGCPNVPFKSPFGAPMTPPPFSPPGRPFCGGTAGAGVSASQGFPVGTGASLMVPASAIVETPMASSAGLAPFNSMVWSIRTTFSWAWPVAPATFSSSGRTGPTTVSWCPGQPPVAGPPPAFQTTSITALGLNPMCPAPGGVAPFGRMVYTAVANQFGGAAPGFIGGTGGIFLAPAGGASLGPPGGGALVPLTLMGGTTFPIGGVFGSSVSTAPPSAPIVFVVGTTTGPIGGAGVVTATGGPTTGGLSLGNAGGSIGGPWTTGMLTVFQTAAAGAPGFELFTLTGSDARTSVSGAGNVTLVSGSISFRATTAGNAGRGIMTLTVPEPTAALTAAGALALLVGCHRLARRRK